MITQEHFERFQKYLQLVHNTVYHEPDTPAFHNRIIDSILVEVIDPLDLPKDSRILDMGCGSGYFLEQMRDRGFTNCVGVTMDEKDIQFCHEKGLTVFKQDMTFTDFENGEFDFLFCRQALEHSPCPALTLCEFNRIVKEGGQLYIELPAPDQDRKHEENFNHYSILGKRMWNQLFDRACFHTDIFNEFKFGLTDEIAPGINVEQTETFFVYKLTKTQTIFGDK
jgi:SAM-dependent methyltransferase